MKNQSKVCTGGMSFARKFCLLTVISLAILSEARCAQIDLPNQGAASYVGFEIERMTGIPERQMSEHGCLYYIDKQLFLKILNKAPSNKANLYNPSNVRARIDFPDMTVYFVDHLGTVKEPVPGLSFGQLTLSFDKSQGEEVASFPY